MRKRRVSSLHSRPALKPCEPPLSAHSLFTRIFKTRKPFPLRRTRHRANRIPPKHPISRSSHHAIPCLAHRPRNHRQAPPQRPPSAAQQPQSLCHRIRPSIHSLPRPKRIGHQNHTLHTRASTRQLSRHSTLQRRKPKRSRTIALQTKPHHTVAQRANAVVQEHRSSSNPRALRLRHFLS
jgi:hypothetical protein